MFESKVIQKIPFRGSSMDPIFKSADFVWIDFSMVEKPKVGDVVVYREDKKEFVCHRVIGKTSEMLFLKGDNSLHGEPVSPFASWGRVVGIEKAGKTQQLKNQLLLSPYCWTQMYFQKKNSILGRRVARKLGLLYLRLVQRLIAK